MITTFNYFIDTKKNQYSFSLTKFSRLIYSDFSDKALNNSSSLHHE